MVATVAASRNLGMTFSLMVIGCASRRLGAIIGRHADFLNALALLFRVIRTRALPPEHRDHTVGEGQALGHHRYEISQQFLAKHRVFELEGFELLRAQDIKNARDLGLDSGAAWRMRDEAHLANRGAASEASHPRRPAAFSRRDHDSDASVENEMHGIGGGAGADDDLAGRDFKPLATMDQFCSVLLGP